MWEQLSSINKAVSSCGSLFIIPSPFSIKAFTENPTTRSECMKDGLLRQPLIQPETRFELVTFDMAGSELEQVRLSLSYDIGCSHQKEWDCGCFVWSSASCISVITWGFALCQQSLRCSMALRMKLMGVLRTELYAQIQQTLIVIARLTKYTLWFSLKEGKCLQKPL